MRAPRRPRERPPPEPPLTDAPTARPLLRDALPALLAGFALGLGFAVVLRRFYGPSALSLWPPLGLGLGLALGCAPAPGAVARVGAGLGLLLLGLATWTAGELSPFLLTAGGGLVAATLVAKRAEPLFLGALAGLGLALGGGLTVAQGVAALGLAGLVALVVADGLRGAAGHAAAAGAAADRCPTPREAWLRGAVGLRLGAVVLLAVAGGAASPALPPLGLDAEGASLLVADGAQARLLSGVTATLLGLLLGRGLSALFPYTPRLALLAELVGWGLVPWLLALLPLARPGAATPVHLLLAASGALGGIALGARFAPGPRLPTARAARWLTVGLGLAFGAPVGALLVDDARARWSPAAQIVRALGDGDPTATTFAAAVAEERVRLRFAPPRGSVTQVAVVEVEAPDERVRLLSIDGRIRGGVPTTRGGNRRVCAAQVLAAALPTLLVPAKAAPEVAVLGLGPGLTTGALLETAWVGERGRVTVVEPRRGVRRLQREPGDLFGFLSGRPLDDPRVALSTATFGGYLRGAAPEHDLLILDHLPLVPPFPRLVRSALGPQGFASWLLLGREVPLEALRFLVRGQRTWIFAPDRDELVVLLSRADAPFPALAGLQARWKAEPRLRARLSAVGLRTPLQVLSTLAVGPYGVEGLAELAGERVEVDALRRVGAETLVRSIAWPGEHAPEAQAALAELLARRKSPAALPLARAAVAAEATSETLRILGDVLHLSGQSVEAEGLWKRAIEAAPEAPAPRLSLAWRLHDREQWQTAREVLLPAVGLDPQREREVQYLLGRLAIGLQDYNAAKRHFRAAKGFKNAANLAKLAATHAKPVEAPLTRPQKLAAGRTLLERARAASDAAQGKLLDDAVGLASGLAFEPAGLSAAQRAELAQLLRGCAALHTARGDATAAKTLARLEAEVLQPLVADPKHVIARAEALGRAGQPAAGEALLVTLLDERADERLPQAHLALGDLRAAQGKFGAAVEAYRRCLAQRKASTTNVRIHLKLADAYRGAKQLARAIDTLQRAERRYPGHPRVRLNLGTLLLEVGRRGDALTAYRKFLAVAPANHPLRKQVEEQVRELSER